MALGSEQNSGDINLPGTYKDPVSGAELTVSMEAGADALVRLGWVYVKPSNDDKSTKIDEVSKKA